MSNRSKTLILLLTDLLILFGSMAAVVSLRIGIDAIPSHIALFKYLFPLWILMFFIEGMYGLRTFDPGSLPISVLRGTFLSVIASMSITYLIPSSQQIPTPKTNLLLIAFLSIPFLYGWRSAFFSYFARSQRRRAVRLVGNAQTVDLVRQELHAKPYLGYRVLTSNDEHPDLVAVDRNTKHESTLYAEIFSLLSTGVEVIDLAKFAEIITGKIPLTAIDQSWFIEHCGYNGSRSYEVTKTILDKTVAVTLIICLLPLAFVVLPLIYLAHGRPLIFKQTRTGKNNVAFTLYKLRTMVIDAEASGAQWAKPKDNRITPIGKLLRKTRLDELPQLINILRGEMSLVGPRPERPEIIQTQLENDIPFYNLRHLVKPGVTGWAQVSFRYGFSKEDSLEKLQFDLYYVKNRSIWLDMVVILKTVKTVLTGAGQ